MWRTARGTDLDAIKAVADAVHPDLSERPEVFEEKLRLFPEGCFVLIENGEVVGYAFVHLWRLNDVPKLDDFLMSLPDDADCLFIHDVALLPKARDKGAARSLIQQISKLANSRNVTLLSLVSVYGSHIHWTRLGFEVVTDDAVTSKLASYGQTAYYMVRRLT
jgi:ribosomal protein S18 acetylase RimI-like enzyme